MINISTDYSCKEQVEKYIHNQTAYFRVIRLNTPLDETDKAIIREIDDAEIIKEEFIEGKFGLTHINNISNGAKTLINLRHLINNNDSCYIDITSCGDNAIELLIKILKPYENDPTKEINLLTRLRCYGCYESITMKENNSKIIHSLAEMR